MPRDFGAQRQQSHAAFPHLPLHSGVGCGCDTDCLLELGLATLQHSDAVSHRGGRRAPVVESQRARASDRLAENVLVESG
jgi:hypothetical protein